MAWVADRGVQILRREGMAGLARRVPRAVEQVAPLVLAREEHIWYELELTPGRPVQPLPSGLELVKAQEPDFELLRELPTSGPDQARLRRAAGADLWIVREGDRAAFSCWIYRGACPSWRPGAAGARCRRAR